MQIPTTPADTPMPMIPPDEMPLSDAFDEPADVDGEAEGSAEGASVGETLGRDVGAALVGIAVGMAVQFGLNSSIRNTPLGAGLGDDDVTTTELYTVTY